MTTTATLTDIAQTTRPDRTWIPIGDNGCRTHDNRGRRWVVMTLASGKFRAVEHNDKVRVETLGEADTVEKALSFFIA